MWFIFVILGTAVFLFSFLLCFSRFFRKSYIFNNKVKTLIVLGSGGHTTEMLTLLTGCQLGDIYDPLIFIIAAEDTLSVKKVNSLFFLLQDRFQILTIRRSRQVGQSYLSSLVTTFLALIESFVICIKSRPNLLLCNGPGTCIPLCFAVKLFSKNCTVVYVESFCRTRSLSLSGKIIYYCNLYDEFLVQWPDLKLTYEKSKYIGLLV